MKEGNAFTKTSPSLNNNGSIASFAGEIIPIRNATPQTAANNINNNII